MGGKWKACVQCWGLSATANTSRSKVGHEKPPKTFRERVVWLYRASLHEAGGVRSKEMGTQAKKALLVT